MKQFEIEKVLAGMKGKTYLYRTENHHILRYSVDKVVKITTDKKDITILLEDFKDVVKSFLEVSEEPEITSTSNANIPATATTNLPIQQTSVIGSSGQELKDILMDNIRKLQSDKDYVAQAQAVNETVKTIIDIARVEVDMFRVMKQNR